MLSNWRKVVIYMYSTNECAKMLTEQGQNVLACIKDLKRIAKNKGKERSSLYERYCANQHSFNVYTYTDATIGNLTEVQAFKRKMTLFGAVFAGTRTDYEAEIDVQQVEKTYEELVTAYGEMMDKLGFSDKALV